MKHFKVHLTVLAIAFAGIFGLSAMNASAGRVQTQNTPKTETGAVTPKTETGSVTPKAETSSTVASPVKPTASVRERGPEVAAETSSRLPEFSAAAQRNSLLRSEMNWIFGGKQQRGWNLYSALINRLLEADHDTSTADFASALSRWQEKSGLSPSGVLDDNSLYAMISTWQRARLKERGYASPDQLFTAPVSDFYDTSRPQELRQVERATYAAYKRMVAAAVADPSLGLTADAEGNLATGERYLKIVSAFRSREYQAKLRRDEPDAGRAALAVNHSPHFTGRALDLYVGGEPVETKDSNRAIQVQTPVYQWLVRNADRFGFRPYYYEPWHWEYVGEVAK